MKDKVLIIGGGIAGLSAAVHSIEKGLLPIIVEKNRHLGGRVRSLETSDVEKTIDNGQHVLSAAYEETRQLLHKIGSLNKIFFQKNFQAFYVKSDQQFLSFRAVPLPAPVHFFLPLLKQRAFTKIQVKDFWNLWKKSIWVPHRSLKKMTINHWLNECQQSQEIRELLWRPISLSILNTPMESGSAYLLLKALRRSFLGPQHKAGLGIPQAWLSEIFAEPAEKFITKAGGEIYYLHAVQELQEISYHKWRVITTKKAFEVPWVISAIPPYALSTILSNSGLPELSLLQRNLKRFEYYPIITINIFCGKPLKFDFPLLLISSPIHWIFPHPQSTNSYAVVISAAEQWVDCSREEVMEMVINEFKKYLGIDLQKDNHLLAYKIVKEKRATIAQTPQSLAWRPATRTDLRHFYLAGDWIATGLPATIESAALSGKKAIEALGQDRK